MFKHIPAVFLLVLAWIETNGQTSPPLKGVVSPHNAASILGLWCRCEGRDTVFLEFDRSNLYLNHDTLTYRVLDELIVIDEFINGIQSQGFIRKLTSDTLLIEWMTGDTDLYRRARQVIRSIDPPETAPFPFVCCPMDLKWFVGKELRVIVDSLALENTFIEVHLANEGKETLFLFSTWIGPISNRIIAVTMDHWDQRSSLLTERGAPLRILQAMKGDPVRDVRCSDYPLRCNAKSR